MFRTDEIRTLTDFRQNAKAHLERMESNGGMEILTVNGEAKVVVMTTKAFDAMAEKAHQHDTTAAILRGLADVQSGRVRDAKDALHELAAKHGVSMG